MLDSISVLFFSLKISSADNKECNSDFVKVMDGDCVSRLGESKFCGDEIPSKFESTTNRLCVKFYSDDSQNDKGFSVSYKSITSQTQQIGMHCNFLLDIWKLFIFLSLFCNHIHIADESC